MSDLSMVTGANGHLGNNLVRVLLDRGERVRATVRNTTNMEPFENLDCEVVYADLLDKESLVAAMKGVDTLYQVAAVFRHWAKNPQRDIIDVNVKGTQNVLEAASEQHVRRIVYVSSIAALDRTVTPIDEATWNSDYSNPYFQSKTESERTALALARSCNLHLVTVLPSAMVGPNCFGRLTTMGLLNNVLNNKLPFDPNFHFNYVDVRDVATTMIRAAERGRNGQRYILANESMTSTTRLFELAQSLFPEVKRPAPVSKRLLLIIAFLDESLSKLTGRRPDILRSQVRLYYEADISLDISKAKKGLGYSPREPETALKEAFMYLANRRA